MEDSRRGRRMEDVDAETPVQMQRGRNQHISGELLRGLRAGSSHAWARLYDLLAPGIHRFAVSCLSGDAETAQDVVVETLAHAARDIACFDHQRSSLSAWIYGIARHRVQAELRWRSRRKSIPAWAQVSFEDLAELADSPDPGARADARLDAQRRVEELPGLLSDAEMELLDLSAVEELPGEEISRVVGRSEQATRSLLKRAKQKVRRTAIEGTLVVGCGRDGRKEGWRADAHLFSGSEDWFAGDAYGDCCDLSPVSDEIAYESQGAGDQVAWVLSCHIWKAKRDGSGAVNLSEVAGLGGTNGCPRWSPDGTLIAFTHWDRPGAWLQGPGEAWVVKADGSEAKRVAPRRSLLSSNLGWSPDGGYLVCRQEGRYDVPPVFVGMWGRRVCLTPPTPREGSIEWSPDGTRVASTGAERGHMEGEPGYWRQLLVMEADGSRPEVLVEQFIADAQLDALRLTPWEIATARLYDYDWRNDALWHAGPIAQRWSPEGDKIAFLAALPFDPDPRRSPSQVWVYDLVTRRLTKVTNGPGRQKALSWR